MKMLSIRFRHEVVGAGNVRIHYVIGGNGPLITLLHGFPQHWREWRLVMPAFSADYDNFRSRISRLIPGIY